MRQPEKSPTWWSTALVLGGIAAALTPAILAAADGGGFGSVVQGIESRYHVHATKIPFLGLMSLVASHATHGGVRGIHVAEIDHLDGPVDGAELNALVAQRVGPGWQRIVRDTSRSGLDQDLIYIKPEGNRLGMLVVDLDHKEMDVVEISIDPNKLSEEITEHRHSRSGDSDEDKSDDGIASEGSE
jgi:hypothetical protein